MAQRMRSWHRDEVMAQRIGVLKSEVQGVRRKTQEIKVGRHVAVKRTWPLNARTFLTPLATWQVVVQ